MYKVNKIERSGWVTMFRKYCDVCKRKTPHCKGHIKDQCLECALE